MLCAAHVPCATRHQRFLEDLAKRNRLVYSCADDSDLLLLQRRKMQHKTWKYKQDAERKAARAAKMLFGSGGSGRAWDGRRKHVVFKGQVWEREYARVQAGSNSVPKTGGHSLGLDWKIAGQCVVPLRTTETAGRTYPAPNKEYELPRVEEPVCSEGQGLGWVGLCVAPHSHVSGCGFGLAA